VRSQQGLRGKGTSRMSLVQQSMAFAELMAAKIERLEVPDGNHSYGVGRIVEAILERLDIGLSPEVREMWPVAASIHDWGKQYVPLEVLRKPGPLTREELILVQSHTTRGFQDLQEYGAKDPDSQVFWLAAAEIALTHHENWDGSGYPVGLTGEEIPLVGRITHVADVLHALTSPRVYHKEMPVEQAMALMCGSSAFDGAFDPEVLAVAAAMVKERGHGGAFT